MKVPPSAIKCCNNCCKRLLKDVDSVILIQRKKYYFFNLLDLQLLNGELNEELEAFKNHRNNDETKAVTKPVPTVKIAAPRRTIGLSMLEEEEPEENLSPILAAPKKEIKSVDKDTEEITVAKVAEKKNLEEKIEMYV